MTARYSKNAKLKQKLKHDLFPSGWKNPRPAELYDLLVIGGGPGGMTAATLAIHQGAKVALVEKAHLGGECVSYGCIPSKAFLRSSRSAAEIRRAAKYGIKVPKGWKVDFNAVVERVHRLQTLISPHNSAMHFKKLGVDVFLGSGHFTGPYRFEVGGRVLTFRKAIIATGTHPVPLQIPGLTRSDYITNEEVFGITTLPRSLAVIGAGPIGCELAQAFARFGTKVTLITRGKNILPREEAFASKELLEVLEEDGVEVHLRAQVKRAAKKGKKKLLYLHKKSKGMAFDMVLVAIGRAPAVEGLGLDAAGIQYDHQKGIFSDDYLMTSNAHIYAVGDSSSEYKFTHVSQELARIAVENALQDKRLRSSALIIPWCTFTDPEVAHVGMTEKEARAKGISVETVLIKMNHVDRAILEEETNGFAKLLIRTGTDQIIGATLMASHAGEMISEITAAMMSEKGLQAIIQAIHPFPTQAEVLRHAAAGLKEISAKRIRETQRKAA